MYWMKWINFAFEISQVCQCLINLTISLPIPCMAGDRGYTKTVCRHFFNPEIENGNNLSKLHIHLKSFIKMIHYNTSKVSLCTWSGYIREIIKLSSRKWNISEEIRLFIAKLLVKMINKKVFPSETSVN